MTSGEAGAVLEIGPARASVAPDRSTRGTAGLAAELGRCGEAADVADPWGDRVGVDADPGAVTSNGMERSAPWRLSCNVRREAELRRATASGGRRNAEFALTKPPWVWSSRCTGSDEGQDVSLEIPGVTGVDVALHERPVELLQRLLRFDTRNPPGSERACIDWLEGVLRAGGLETRVVAADPERPNLVARLRGEGVAADRKSTRLNSSHNR
jgi:hypothetical protein